MRTQSRDLHRLTSGVGLFAASLIIVVGTFWAFDRGAPDFNVFFAAWTKVLKGRGSEIYQLTSMPDRFLYAPGFAWLFSPLALLPRDIALAIWCLGKAAIVGYVVQKFRTRDRMPMAAAGLAGWGVVLVARPLLIDFQYGQVNLLILVACAWALVGHYGEDRVGFRDFLRWMILGVAALGKVFPLPLLAVPWIARQGVVTARLRWERAGAIAGVAITLLLPMSTQGWRGGFELLGDWRQALVLRGLPLESHNQSFAAFLHHFFSGEPTRVMAYGVVPQPFGAPWLSVGGIGLLSFAWMAFAAGFLLSWLLSADRRAQFDERGWIAVMLLALIMPSHLIWKPYFVMALPLAILLTGQRGQGVARSFCFVVLFFAMNLSGFDLVGPSWGDHFEAGSVMLWSALGMIALWSARRQERPVDRSE